MSVRSRILALAATALAVTAQLLVPSPAGASAPGDWGPVRTLTANPRGEALVVDAHGAVTAVWATSSTHAITTVRRSSSGAWGAPEVIGHGYEPHAAVDRRGTVTVAWTTQRSGHTDGVTAARRPVGGTWSDPVRLSHDRRVPGYVPDGEEPYGATHVDLAVAPSGAAVVAWAWGSDERDVPSRVQSAYRAAGGTWSGPVDVTPAGGAAWPLVGIDAHGAAVVVYGRQPFGHPQSLRARQRLAGGRWTAPTTVSREGYAPTLAVDRAGRAVLVFSGASDRVEAAYRPASGRWQDPQPLSPAGVDVTDFALATDGHGAVSVALGRAGGRVDLTERTARTGWSAAEKVVGGGGVVYDVLLSRNASGDTFLGWGGYALHGRYRPDGGVWEPRTRISPDAGVDVLESTHAVVAPDGTVVVLWKQEARPLKIRATTVR